MFCFFEEASLSFGKICQLVLINTCEMPLFLKIANIWKFTKFFTDYKKLVGIGVLSEAKLPKFQPCFASGLSSIIRWKSCKNLTFSLFKPALSTLSSNFLLTGKGILNLLCQCLQMLPPLYYFSSVHHWVLCLWVDSSYLSPLFHNHCLTLAIFKMT